MSIREIKLDAKEFLRGKWTMAAVVAFIYNMIIGAASSVFSGALYFVEALEMSEVVIAIIYILNFAVTFIVQSAVLLGFMTIMMKIAAGRSFSVGELFSCTSSTMKVFGLTITIFIKVLLWSFLLVIPGIIKGLSYSMAFYILADDPTKSVKQCIDESKEMMKGNKGKLFGLQLSFMGWVLLMYAVIIIPFLVLIPLAKMLGPMIVLLLCLIILALFVFICVGMYVLMVYMEVSRVTFYFDIKQNQRKDVMYD
ncbi:MAG: DUF975 family protein [Lachnospiraceae bacterium]|nr:DUF975 family protein [Lachnospiraceae bacterium]